MVEFNIVDEIKTYFEKRGLKTPDFNNAMKFALTEIAEVFELDLAREGGWVRNNPDSKPDYSKEDMAEELGDVIMMIVMAGLAEGVDPIDALYKKLKRKTQEHLLKQIGFDSKDN